MTHDLHHGIELFNEGEYFECHEVIEAIWTPVRGPRRWFLQALIHLAVALHHHRQNNPEGMRRQLDKGLKKLAGYLPVYEGVATAKLYGEMLQWASTAVGPPPKIIELQSE